MHVLDAITSRAGRLAGDMQNSIKRARVEGERRMLARQHRTALEELGLRAYELTKAGDLPEGPLTAEVAAVEARLIEIEAKVAEIDALRGDDEPAADPSGDASPPPDAEPAKADDPALTAFPMIADTPPPDGAPEDR